MQKKSSRSYIFIKMMNNVTMSIEEITSKDQWNSFVVSVTDDTFHQAWEWGETYKNKGSMVWYLGLLDENRNLVGASLTIKVTAKRGSFLLVPHGPLFINSIRNNEKELAAALKVLTTHLIELAKKEHCTFIRIAPTLKRNEENAQVFRSNDYKKAPIFVQSELSWRLNLEPSEEELLSGMRKSTRYILKRADSYGLTITSSANHDDFERFYDLYKETVKNQEFVGQGKGFIEEEFRTFSASGNARLYFAQSQQDGKAIDLATAMIITQGSSGFYHYGASRKDDKNTPAPHLLQWHIIKDLKARGFSYYNFWGISEEDKPNHPWRGLSIFKRGFGGEELAYLKTQDYILSPLYWLNWVVETARRIKRNY